jgi:hypothetical protein
VFSGNAVTGNGTDVESDYIRNRTIQLNLFANQISNIPFLASSSVLKTFLSSPDEFKTLDFTYIPGAEISEGERAWKLLIDSVPLISNYDGIIVDIKRQLTLLRNTLRQLQDECVALSKATLVYTKQLKSTNDKFTTWNNMEKDIADPAKNLFPNNNPLFPSYLDAILDSFDHWSKTSQVTYKSKDLFSLLC